jgi:hypothetical protein
MGNVVGVRLGLFGFGFCAQVEQHARLYGKNGEFLLFYACSLLTVLLVGIDWLHRT